MRYESLTEMIGSTPLLRPGKLFPEREGLAKCEFMTPLRVKDRPVLQILEDAEKCCEMARREGLLVGITSGATIQAARDTTATTPGLTVCVLADRASGI